MKQMEINKIYNEDCLEGMKTLSDNSVDSVVTDPPYELGFMGKSWDSTGIAYNVEMWKEVLRVLKPGGHLLAFGGTRTYHRMACAIEDAGFEIRDQMQWIYGSGFPKSMDISKAIGKSKGATREVIGQSNSKGIRSGQNHIVGDTYECEGYPITSPTTPEAKQWDGWGTALKPANEPIVVARKPLSEKTVVANILRWGAGGLNINECRIGNETEHVGRFPANIILDEAAGELLDAQSGQSTSKQVTGKRSGKDTGRYGAFVGQDNVTMGHDDSGGASRFFYCAKAAKKERGDGNVHPTVKPMKLMKYLVQLVTPPKGVVLDPFAGSGTTAIACMNTNRNFIGFEMDKGYYDIACKRIKDKVEDDE